MSGPLVGLVREHGPEDHNAWAVLTVIAEDLRGPMKSCCLSYEALAQGARLSLTSVRRAVALLVRDKWVARHAGMGRGNASTYRLRLQSFPLDAVEKVVGKVVTEDTFPEDKGGHTDPLSDLKVFSQSLKVVSQDTPSVSVTTPSAETAPDPDRIAAELEAARALIHANRDTHHEDRPEPRRIQEPEPEPEPEPDEPEDTSDHLTERLAAFLATDETRPDHPGNGKAATTRDGDTPALAPPGGMARITRGDRRNMMAGLGRR